MPIHSATTTPWASRHKLRSPTWNQSVIKKLCKTHLLHTQTHTLYQISILQISHFRTLEHGQVAAILRTMICYPVVTQAKKNVMFLFFLSVKHTTPTILLKLHPKTLQGSFDHKRNVFFKKRKKKACDWLLIANPWFSVRCYFKAS